MAVEEKVDVIEEFTGFVYTAGNGGSLIRSQKVSSVMHAAVEEISGQAIGDVELLGYIDSVNIQTGTIGAAPATTNGMKLFLYTAATGTIVEEATGTITEKVKVHITGY